MLGLEPQKRNRNTNITKNKVTKAKKDTKPASKRGEEAIVKPESDVKGRGPLINFHSRSPPVKLESQMGSRQPSAYHASQFTPTSAPSPVGPDFNSASAQQMRLLTPCSDDVLPGPHRLQFSPPTNMLGNFDLSLATGGPCDHDDSQREHHGEQLGAWAPSPAYSVFDAAFNLNTYGLPEMCDHGHSPVASPPSELHGTKSAVMMRPFEDQAEVKHEHWDVPYHH